MNHVAKQAVESEEAATETRQSNLDEARSASQDLSPRQSRANARPSNRTAVSMRTGYKSSNQEGNPFTNFALGLAFTAAIFFLLPAMHILGQLSMKTRDVVVMEAGEAPPPPPPEELPPPPEKKEKIEKPEVEEPPPPMTLSQMEMALNPGSGDATGDFGFGDFDQGIDIMADMEIFNIDDLDEIPRMVRSPFWSWPRYALGQIKEDVRAKALIFINPDGRVELRRLQGLQYKMLTEDITKWVEEVRFTAPKRNGKAVRAQYLFPLEFAKP